jgi:hypothetical protein
MALKGVKGHQAAGFARQLRASGTALRPGHSAESGTVVVVKANVSPSGLLKPLGREAVGRFAEGGRASDNHLYHQDEATIIHTKAASLRTGGPVGLSGLRRCSEFRVQHCHRNSVVEICEAAPLFVLH